jgi:hypothetical protein
MPTRRFWRSPRRRPRPRRKRIPATRKTPDRTRPDARLDAPDARGHLRVACWLGGAQPRTRVAPVSRKTFFASSFQKPRRPDEPTRAASGDRARKRRHQLGRHQDGDSGRCRDPARGERQSDRPERGSEASTDHRPFLDAALVLDRYLVLARLVGHDHADLVGLEVRLDQAPHGPILCLCILVDPRHESRHDSPPRATRRMRSEAICPKAAGPPHA